MLMRMRLPWAESFLKSPSRASGKQSHHWFALAVFGDVNWALLDLIRQIWWNAQGVVHGCVQIFNGYGVVDDLAWPLVCCFTEQESLLDASPKHEDAASL